MLSASTIEEDALNACTQMQRKRKLACFLQENAQAIVAKIVLDAPHLIEGMLSASAYPFDLDYISIENSVHVCRVDANVVGKMASESECAIAEAEAAAAAQAEAEAAAAAQARIDEANALAEAEALRLQANVDAAKAEDAAKEDAAKEDAAANP